MADDIFMLDIPNFIPIYSEDTNLSNLKQLLIDTSHGYCMYCFSKIVVDRKNFAHIEHSIEKINSTALVKCIPNLAVACPLCNLSFKKKDEVKRVLSKEEKREFKKGLKCEKNCTTICSNYIALKTKFVQKEHCKIILQPNGVSLNGKQLLMQYNILAEEVIPSQKLHYSKEELDFINKHIKRFNLNDIQFKTHEVSRIAQNIYDSGNIINNMEPLNLIAELFLKRLKNLKIEDAIMVCKIIISNHAATHRGKG